MPVSRSFRSPRLFDQRVRGHTPRTHASSTRFKSQTGSSVRLASTPRSRWYDLISSARTLFRRAGAGDRRTALPPSPAAAGPDFCGSLSAGRLISPRGRAHTRRQRTLGWPFCRLRGRRRQVFGRLGQWETSVGSFNRFEKLYPLKRPTRYSSPLIRPLLVAATSSTSARRPTGRRYPATPSPTPKNTAWPT